MIAVATAPWLDDLGRGLRESGLMVWGTLWALVFGFLLAGAVRTFVPARAVERRLGTRRPRSVGLATLYGMASSSCSYAASSTSGALLERGADPVAAVVFLVASTNLVLELGLAIVALLGWRFLVGQSLGGLVMVVLLALFGGTLLRGTALDAARDRLARRAGPALHAHTDAHTDAHHETSHGAHDDGGSRSRVDATRPGVGSVGGWVAATRLALGEARMLRRELVFGFLAAGFVAALVPTTAWRTLFVRGPGSLAVLERAAVGPLVAALSCVCSIGNVPLAAAIWHAGVGLGGTLGFLFADLLALPLLAVYRRLYGGAFALRLAVALYVSMVAAALAVERLLTASGLAPALRGGRLVVDRFTWGPTSALDLAALSVLAVLLVLARRSPGSAHGVASCPTHTAAGD